MGALDATKLLLSRGCSQGLKLPQSTPGIGLNPCASREGPRGAGAVATALILVVVLGARRCRSAGVAHADVVAVYVAASTVCYLCSPDASCRGCPRASGAVAAALDQSRSACSVHVAAWAIYGFTIAWRRRRSSSAPPKSARLWPCRRSLVLLGLFDASRHRSACAAQITGVL